MIIRTAYKYLRPFNTKDGSTVRELMHPDIHGNARQSLAEAIVPIGGTTVLHKHIKSEEIYHITLGQGLLFLGEEQLEVIEGDTVYIPPGTPHKIRNTGETSLKILCCSCPAYSHDDTELLP